MSSYKKLIAVFLAAGFLGFIFIREGHPVIGSLLAFVIILLGIKKHVSRCDQESCQSWQTFVEFIEDYQMIRRCEKCGEFVHLDD
ncbi:MAG TPA: hypothetical protein DIT25_03685 [Candidatus Moranbacteria bacterium]|nr:hypothetical protein [Candidatus Moranbacteria bacterium]